MIKAISYEIRRLKRHKKKILKSLSLFVVGSALLLSISSTIDHDYLQTSFYQPKSDSQIDGDFEGSLYFNDGENRVDYEELLLKAVYGAKESINVAMYSFDMFNLKEALERVMEKGVDVKLILDQSKKEQHDLIFGEQEYLNIVEVGGDINQSGDYMHNKFSIFDKGTESEKILFGSFNYTELQNRYDPSFILETGDEAFIEAFSEEWELISSGIRGYKKLKENEYKPFSRLLKYNNGFVEIWFTPGFRENSVKQRMLDLIDSAEESIDMIIWRMTDDDIANALYRRARDGVFVRIITDDYYLWAKDSAIKWLVYRMENDGFIDIEIVSDLYRTLDFADIVDDDLGYFNPYIHQHTMIVDGNTVLSGSNNWSYNGFYKNDESIVISDVDFWVDGFKQFFESLYLGLRRQKLGDDFSADGRLVIYNEVSERKVVPEICFESDYYDAVWNEIPEECKVINSHAFILDDEMNVLAGGYYLPQRY